MKNFNNLYNFKNPIRHFFNLDKIQFDNSEDLTIDDFSWTKPIKFKIFKTEDSHRTLSFPNVLNFYHAIKCFQDEEHFYNIKKISSKKRVSPDLNVGEFSALSYYEALQEDIFNLTKYDKLLILDIKSFYGRIYTHDFGYVANDAKKLEQRVGSLNSGRTNGLLLGSYLSLYLAEKFLIKIEKELDNELKKQKIDCHYEYFSDDFYFFCNNSDIESIKQIFSKVLDCYELQVNYDKTSIFDFEQYTKNNNLEKLWKKIIKESLRKDLEARRKQYLSKEKSQHPAFFTQLVYRLSQIQELKYKRIFLANFFKTYYFYHLDPKLYTLSESDFNYVCYIYKLMPETIIYSLPKIKMMKNFNFSRFQDFVVSRFKIALQTERYEEQVYFYYAIKICGFDAELERFKLLVLESKNQILISYFLIDKVITEKDYQQYISVPEEGEWLQNYHYLLVYNNTEVDILLPENAKREKQKTTYRKFYELNLSNKIPMVRPIDKVGLSVNDFIARKLDTYKGII